MLQDKLCQIGFTPNESRIYLELLRLGPQAVSVIAKRIRLNRSTAYTVLKALEKKGIVACHMNGSIKFFSANDPNSLIGYIDRKCKTFTYYRGQLLTAIPKFRRVVDKYAFKKPVVSYFDGLEGVQYVMDDALNALDSLRSYQSLSCWVDPGIKDFLIEFRALRPIDKQIPVRMIVPDTKEVRAFFKRGKSKKPDFNDILYISDDDSLAAFGSGMNIYNNKVSFLYLDKGDEYGVVIESDEIAEMHKKMFDMAWVGFDLEEKSKKKEPKDKKV